MKNKKLFSLVLGLFILVGVGITYYYHYQSVNYVKTEDARIMADTISVTPKITGELLNWNVCEGDNIKKGQRLGRIDLSDISNNGNVNILGLEEQGSSLANKAFIDAPINGRIIKSQVREGQTVVPGQTLATIADTDDLYISANIEEIDISKVKIDQKVKITIDALDNQEFIGTVDEIGQAANSVFSIMSMQNSNGNFTKVTQLVPVKIRFPELNSLNVVPGMNVIVKICIK